MIFKNIPAKFLKVTSDICSPFLVTICNQELILNEKFPQKLKLADITPLFNLRSQSDFRALIQTQFLWCQFN